VFYQLLARCRAVAGTKRFRFKNKLLSLDATIIDLCAELFPWAEIMRKKGELKLHFANAADDSRQSRAGQCQPTHNRESSRKKRQLRLRNRVGARHEVTSRRCDDPA
jgi:hypothetical protein